MGVISTFKTITTSNQDIDLIEIDKYQSVEYKIKAYSANSISESVVKVSTDGVVVFDTQSGFSSNNGPPLEYTTDNLGYVGRLKVTPTSNNMTFYIDKTVYESEQYAIHTQSGRKIVAEEGVSLDRESSLYSLTIKSANVEFYGLPSTYLVSNVFGPVLTGDALLTEWQSFNNADILLGDELKVISSGQNQNFAYQKIEVTPGKAYKIYGGAYYVDPDAVNVKENNQYQSGDSFIRISSDLDRAELLNFQLTSTYTEVSEVFFPDTTEIYVKVGYGKRSVEAFFDDLQLKEVVPFYTYNQNTGTYYIKWSGLDNTNLLETNNLLSLESGNIKFNGITIGTQSVSNQLCIAYETDRIHVSLNGSATQEYLINNLNRNYTLELNPSVLRFSYMNEILSEANLEKLSSG